MMPRVNQSDANKTIYSSDAEMERRAEFDDLFWNSPIPRNEILGNIGLFIKRQELSRILYMQELYIKIVPVHGIVVEFGVRWGRNLGLWSSFRGMYEPFNYNRKIVGFDTFTGLSNVVAKDGTHRMAEAGTFATAENYEAYLDEVMKYHEAESPLGHIKKYEIIKGDVRETLPAYLHTHPETIIALAYFDLDLYEPTRACLETIRPFLTRGSVLAFDELNYEPFPGETVALREIMGLDRYAIRRSVHTPVPAYLVIE